MKKNSLHPSVRAFVGFLKRLAQQNWHYILVTIFSLVLSVGLWGSINTYLIGDDYAFHIERLQGAVHALQDGQIFMQIDPNGMFGFGYAYNLFYGPLLTWLVIPIRLIFSSWPVAINLLSIIFLLLSGVLSCYTVTKISQNKVLGAICGILYLAMPYHLMNLYSRFALAEFAGMAFLPLLLLGLYQLTNHQEHALRNLAFSAICLLLTHNLMTFLGAFMALIYLLLNLRTILNWGSIKNILLTCLVTLCGAACFLLPMFEAKLTGDYGIFDQEYFSVHVEANAKRMEDRHATLSALLDFDHDNAKETVDDVGIGLVAVIGLVGFWFTWNKIRNRPERKFVISMYAIAIISLILTTSLVNWHLFPSFFSAIQFPWRFLAIFSVAISVVASYTLYELISDLALHRQKICVILISIFTMMPVLNLFSLRPEFHTSADTVLDLSPTIGSAGWSAEYAPMALLCDDESIDNCSRNRAISYLQERGKGYRLQEGEANLTNYYQQGTNVNFDISTTTTSLIELPLIWYPGYRAQSEQAKLETFASTENGLVVIRVPSNLKQAHIRVSYQPTMITALGFIISAITLIVTLGWPLWRKVFHRLGML